MDFFRSQDVARQKTGSLVVYFLLAVVIINVLVYCVVAIAVAAANKKDDPFAAFDPKVFAMSTAGVMGLIVLGSLFKIAQLSQGGKVVAEALGGRPLQPATRDPLERRLLNVVEEMAIASGVPAPPVYVMDQEPGVNAFAAGFAPGDAVIGVTRGCMEQLTRDELQGVIAHEFSHILNGDMRLSIRLMGLLNGILLLALTGAFILRMFDVGSPSYSRRYGGGVRIGGSSGSDDKKGGGAGIILVILAIGVGLYIIGYIGVFFGRLIKAGVSRQREFLADASAVQFTRHPQGLAGALARIGGYAGSKMRAPAAEEASHLYFANGMGKWFIQAFATHPPVKERIMRIDPDFTGRMISEEPAIPPGVAEVQHEQVAGFAAAGRRSVAVEPEEAVETVGDPHEEHIEYARSMIGGLPGALTDAAHEPFSARALVAALVVADNHADRADAFEKWKTQADKRLVAETERLLPAALATAPEQRLPLVEISYPALQHLSPMQREEYRRDIDALVKADAKITLFEFMVQRTLLRRLLDEPRRQRGPGIARVEDMPNQAASLLGALAYAGERSQAAFAFQVGADRLGLSIQLPPQEQCTLGEVAKVLDLLSGAAPAVKRRLLDASAACIGADGNVTVREAELFRAVGDSLNCPVPPLFAGALGKAA